MSGRTRLRRGSVSTGAFALATDTVTARRFAIAAVTIAVIAVAPSGSARAQESPAAAGEPPFPIAAWSRTAAGAEDRGTLAERGAAVFNNWCSACHSRGPINAPGTTSLQNKYQGALPAALEDREDLTAALVAFYVRTGVATMPFLRKTELGDDDLEALAAYLARN
jgi:mono/diheme cytochrome c family protein